MGSFKFSNASLLLYLHPGLRLTNSLQHFSGNHRFPVVSSDLAMNAGSDVIILLPMVGVTKYSKKIDKPLVSPP
jgi:hypothetical protein